MKKNINSATKKIIVATFCLLSLISSCKKSETETVVEDKVTSSASRNEETGRNVLLEYAGMSSQTLWELQQARAATARYRNFDNAIADQYVDINVIVPEMGYHYLKLDNLDAGFDMRKPEILVYNREENGHMELVAVEYAVPISLSPNTAPAGFTGTQDVWYYNTYFGLWLLHAWVWSYNPDGVFHPTNPLVHVH